MGKGFAERTWACKRLNRQLYDEFMQQRSDDLQHQEELVETDALTRMRSRYAYVRAVGEYQRGEALPHGLAVFSIDINGLKTTNDNRGMPWETSSYAAQPGASRR